MTATEHQRHLFSCTGIEVEFMIVDRETLDVRPVADRVLRTSTGDIVSELESGRLAWSNELVAHVVEVKTNGPVAAIDKEVLDAFEESVRTIDGILRENGARLLPTAMHPWMDPASETALWPHEYNAIYQAYDRIFGCSGHGWSNLQSLHLNLPFRGDEEFARLHQAVRLLLPLLPALAASSPLVEGKLTGVLDNRMHFYHGNSSRIPSVAGQIVPEPVFDRAAYQQQILERMYRDVAPLDPEGILCHEFLNSRGAIARFDRGSIEIRVIDSQECPRADLAIAAGVVAVLRHLTVLPGTPVETGPDMSVLVATLHETVVRGGGARIIDPDYLAALGQDPDSSPCIREVLRQLVDLAGEEGLLDPTWAATLCRIIDLGCLAERIRAALDGASDHQAIRAVYQRLADCLVKDVLFEPGADP